VRLLTDATGAATGSADFDAFGNLISQTGSTTSAFLYEGEQLDPDLDLYYLRARYYSAATGRFWTSDPVEGNMLRPLSLHRYIYAAADPVDKIDPSGQLAEGGATDVGVTLSVSVILQTILSAGFRIAPFLATACAAVFVATVTVSAAGGPTLERGWCTGGDNRGRIQVQGEDMPGGKPDSGISFRWAVPFPLPEWAGLGGLESLRLQLNDDQLDRRSKAFADAQRFIENAARVVG
jgi:RHS repeat-associated protein